MLALTFIHSLPKSMPMTDPEAVDVRSDAPAITALKCMIAQSSSNSEASKQRTYVGEMQ
jgi:hypothetical protein